MKDHLGDRLISAIREGDLDAVKSLLDIYGMDVMKLGSQHYPFLCESLRNKKEDIAKLLIQHDANVNEAKNCFKTPLHYAAERGYTEVVSMLLEKGALVTAKSIHNHTALHYAVDGGNLKIIELLLNEMADIETKTKFGLTPLHRAVNKGNLKVIELLLNKTADIEARTKSCLTPLHLAVKLLGGTQTLKDKFDHKLASRCTAYISKLKVAMDTADARKTYTNGEQVVKLLLDHGANVDARNGVGETVLEVAIVQGNFRIIESILLSQSALKGHRKKIKERCLRIAVKSAGIGYRGIVELLVGYGFKLKRRDAKPGLLHGAVRNGYTGIIDDLLKLGADVEATHKIANGGTLLHSAAASGRIRIAELLVEHGADVDAKDKKNKTPILYAVENMDPDMTKLFLTNGAKAESTPSLLHSAAESGCSHTMEMILEKMPSIDVNAVENFASASLRFVEIDPELQLCAPPICKDPPGTNYELTALHVAAAGGFAGVVELLLKHNANIESLAERVGTPLHCSVLQKDEAIVEMLLLKGAEVDAKRGDGTTPLHLAVKEGNANIFEVLIKHGADIHERNNRGLNLVHIATEYSNLKMFEEDLLDVFTAGYPKDDDGLTALHYAVWKGRLVDVEILLRHGADPSVQDKNGRTPLHVAAIWDREGRVVKALLNSLGNIDTKDNHGNTALHVAVKDGILKVVHLLLFHGSDVNIKNMCGQTPLEILTDTNYLRFLHSDNRIPLEEDMENNFDEFVSRSMVKVEITIKAMMIIEQIVKMMALGRYVNRENGNCIDVSTLNTDLHDRCKEAVESMKRTKIGESKVSFYEFLTTGQRWLALYSRNRIIAEVLERGDHKDTFKLYGDMIDLRFRKMKIIKDLLDPSARSLCALSGYSLSDYDCVEIVGYLDRGDLENVIKAGASDEKSKRIRDL